MKKMKLTVVILSVFCILSACKKEYSCYCRKGGVSYDYTGNYSKKSKAEDWCRNKIASQDTVYCGLVN